MALFAARGYEKTTVEGIISHLGVAKGCFYHHFTSKDAVYAACVEAIADDVLGRYLSFLEDRSISPRSRLVAYLDHTYQVPMRGGVLSALHADGFRDLHTRVVDEVVAKLQPVMTALVQ